MPIQVNREYFRAMIPKDDGVPLVGPGKRKLGVVSEETALADRAFGPGTGGMSVSPDSLWHVPNHRRARPMRRGATGPAQDWIFAIHQSSLRAASLSPRLDPNDPAKHAFVEPLQILAFSAYVAALSTTQATWRRAWPQDLA